MELQTYLQHNGLDLLCQTYAIKASWHQELPQLVCLKYSQLESPMGEKIVQQCRGIVLDSSQNWQIVSYPYDKFFNYGETHAVAIDWNSATVYEKLDGSLMVLYFYQDQWRVQSSGTADASGKVEQFGITFADLFWRVWRELGYRLPENPDYCFIFELMTPYNRVVVRHTQNKLVLHGVRNLKTLKEEALQDWAESLGWQVVASYPLQTWDDIYNAAQTLDPMDSEGYIVCDRHFNRIKVKSPQYVAMSHMRSQFSSRKFLEIIRNNEGEEFLSYYPEWTELYRRIQQRYEALAQDIERVYQQYQAIELQKEFAMAVKDLPYSGVLFLLRSGKIDSVKEGLKNMLLYRLEDLLQLEYIAFSTDL
jgi:RNA ligase